MKITSNLLLIIFLLGCYAKKETNFDSLANIVAIDPGTMTLDEAIKELQSDQWHPLMILRKVKIERQERTDKNLINACRLVIDSDQGIWDESKQSYPVSRDLDISNFIIQNSAFDIEVFEGELVFVSDLAKAAKGILIEHEKKRIQDVRRN